MAAGASFSAEHPFERAAFRALCAVLFVLLCGYFYFVSASVLNIIARKEADTKNAMMQSAVAQMEKEYFALRDAVGQAEASTLGLSKVQSTQYVYVPGNAATAGTIARSEI